MSFIFGLQNTQIYMCKKTGNIVSGGLFALLKAMHLKQDMIRIKLERGEMPNFSNPNFLRNVQILYDILREWFEADFNLFCINIHSSYWPRCLFSLNCNVTYYCNKMYIIVENFLSFIY